MLGAPTCTNNKIKLYKISVCGSRDKLKFDFLCYILLTYQISLHECLYVWNIKQYVYCSYLFPSLICHKLVVIYAATCVTFKPNLERYEKSTLKKFLIFSQKKLFLYFRKIGLLYFRKLNF